MQLSNERLLADTQGLSQLTQKSLPIKVSYAIAKNIAKIQTELKVYDAERQKLIDKYSVKDADGKTLVGEDNQITIQIEFLEAWKKDIKDLQEIDVEIDIHKFNIDSLVNGNYDMSPGELMLLDYMILEE
ncbi:hypothetical protein KPL40_03985 [Clostridium gasigenes]|uniref:hypothetical protein n=1 Tax=Clostridium gasigenes TaxID=94869 RepID=UPI001C0AF3B5|nr:hypothetical protein [Clostridium gasigenes]MBU3131602.1 hypothetical protein [Clostridium gasigenes]